MGNDGKELVDARLLDFSGPHPVIGMGETDTDAARTKAKELRRFADNLLTWKPPSPPNLVPRLTDRTS